jgi:hypothetical protein
LETVEKGQGTVAPSLPLLRSGLSQAETGLAQNDEFISRHQETQGSYRGTDRIRIEDSSNWLQPVHKELIPEHQEGSRIDITPNIMFIEALKRALERRKTSLSLLKASK